MSERTSEQLALLRRTLEYIEQHLEEWGQGSWRCGSAACFAGHAAILAGRKWTSPIESFVFAEPDDPENLVVTVPTKGGWTLGIHVSNAARIALGLTSDEADTLFLSERTLDDLRRYVENLEAGRELWAR